MQRADWILFGALAMALTVIALATTGVHIDWSNVLPWLTALGPLLAIPAAIFVPWWLANRAQHAVEIAILGTISGLAARTTEAFANLALNGGNRQHLLTFVDGHGQADMEMLLKAWQAIDVTVLGDAWLTIRLVEIRSILSRAIALIETRADTKNDPFSEAFALSGWFREIEPRLKEITAEGLSTTRWLEEHVTRRLGMEP